ncbi:phosphatidylinositol-glycan biosynthesis class S protein-domain-containing protein [Desarmillaria tabescens]|uniref:Phosphatidylinositol-glycan biosynthesis class S protein-domain-containing protein n=1 Tax=Armillaria tabescens TaxID=1929756 RepID=A0AA39MX04_ARMTA|nr:phosphatidylinositol-glycan biosynthesis class S protein-domain-containing protein [Desarmillaria tabescens]KAK0449747.1 phosphatidylinositol-glycan biosynthesis class S protein-domain-containing protein [Desarmillaria tabescens]
MSASRGHETPLRDPSSIFFQSDRVRRLIIASYWVVILLATPLWWHTTSIERLSLPTAQVQYQAKTLLSFPIALRLAPSLVQYDPSITGKLQQFFDTQSSKGGQWRGLSIHVEEGSEADSLDIPGTYSVTSTSSADTVITGRRISFPIHQRPLSHLADLLATLLVPYSSDPDREYRIAQYSPRFRLSFTLLNEDAAAGQVITGWDLTNAIHQHVDPIVTALSILHNFTIESQVQFHAPLAFKPQALDNESFGLTPEDLTVFINSAEWTLSSSSSNDPVLHFVLFVPSSAQQTPPSLSHSNSFLIPQWGGVTIYNPSDDNPPHRYMSSADLDTLFPAFSNQLLALLGLPGLHADVRISPDDNSLLSDWQLDALLRRRAFENDRGAKDTLRSTVKLVDQIKNMPVGQFVRNDVWDALSALEKMHSLSANSLVETMRLSADAATHASRAFFNPGMLALLYFPPEHKYAVYTPLFASAVIPLIAAALREFLAWRRQRRQVANT